MGEREASYCDRGLAYCGEVLAGEIPACKWVKAACQRQLDDLERWRDDGPYYFDADEADRVCRFIELHWHIKGIWARQRTRIRLEEWQCFIVTSIFGWRRRSDGLRRFRTAYLEVARKNAKTTLLAVLGLYMLTADGEAGAEVYSLATTKEQARISFTTAQAMARREAQFRSHFGVQVLAHNISVDETSSKFEALSSDDNSLDGLNVHFGIIDELHAHKTRAVWDVIETATGARSQPIVFAITTAGSNRAGICYEQRSYVCGLLNQVLQQHEGMGYRVEGSAIEDETYFGLVYTIDEDDDWTDPIVWRKANPNLGVSVFEDDIARKCRKAQQLASAQPNFLTKHLNVWVNADSAWMDMVAWSRCGDPTMRPEEFVGWDCVIGLDLASKVDFCSAALVFRRSGQYRYFGRHYLPESRIEDSDNSQFAGWAEKDQISETSGNTTDYEVIEADLRDWVTRFSPRAIVYDPGWGWDFCQRLKNEGLPMIELPATVPNYSEPMKEVEAMTVSGRLRHDGNPAMEWMISNVVCHRDARDQIYPRKERNENKIDGPVAMIAAVAVLMRVQAAPEFILL